MEDQKLTPMMKQYLETKKEFPDGILLFRAGDFYEMFYDDAKIASQLLNITLTKRGKGDTEAPLAGIPYHSIDPYIIKLIKNGKKVIICEQIEDPKLAKGLVKRAVTRIITPSTLFSENYDNNFLCSIVILNKKIGLSIVDITTGEFKSNSFDNFEEILNELSLIKPKELIISKNILNDFNKITELKKNQPNTIINYSENTKIEDATKSLQEHFKVNLNVLGLSDKPEAAISADCALKYLKETQFSDLEYISIIKEYNTNKYLKLDSKTIQNLELISINTQSKNTLFDLINETRTAMGYRKLYFDILHPLRDKEEIIKINFAVKSIKENICLLNDLKQQLSYIGDLDKIISKIGFGNANPRDLIALKQSLQILPEIKNILKGTNSEKIIEIKDNLILLEDEINLLESAIVPEPPATVRDGGFIKPTFSKELFDIVNINKNTNAWLLEYESKLRQKTSIKSLKLKYNKIFGYYIEIPKSQTDNLPEFLERKQTLVNSERYTTKELYEKESQILNAKEKRIELECSLFLEICKNILQKQEDIKKISSLIGTLDEYFSFALVSNLYDYNMPEHNNSEKIIFKELRHPLIETRNTFIPNDCILDEETKTMIITGPNMAGKSSYMRSVCLALILGRIGSFVPAKQSQIGKIDGIYTRIGASDDIQQGQSTFLVEMSEVAYIINNATKDSIVILDEVGRGTSTYDGISLAWSIIEYLNNNINCKTLVATHYHLLNKMEGVYSGIKNYHVTAKEEGDNLHFYHKLQKGGINKSYGIQVAKLAGINKEIIEKAKDIQKDLENDSFLKSTE